MKNKIQTRASIIEPYGGDILRVSRIAGVAMVQEDLIEMAAAYKTFVPDGLPKLLVILDERCDSDLAFLKKMGEAKRQALKKAEALIVPTLDKRLEANFYIQRFKPTYLVAVFSKEEDGLKWLQSID